MNLPDWAATAEPCSFRTHGDPRCAGYVAHLGGMKPGDAKPIPPFPEPEIDPKPICVPA